MVGSGCCRRQDCRAAELLPFTCVFLTHLPSAHCAPRKQPHAPRARFLLQTPSRVFRSQHPRPLSRAPEAAGSAPDRAGGRLACLQGPASRPGLLPRRGGRRPGRAGLPPASTSHLPPARPGRPREAGGPLQRGSWGQDGPSCLQLTAKGTGQSELPPLASVWGRGPPNQPSAASGGPESGWGQEVAPPGARHSCPEGPATCPCVESRTAKADRQQPRQRPTSPPALPQPSSVPGWPLRRRLGGAWALRGSCALGEGHVPLLRKCPSSRSSEGPVGADWMEGIPAEGAAFRWYLIVALMG